jgi:O-antigen ligase
MISEESPGHRIFGVGPDCFNSYAKAYHRDEVKLMWGDKLLTNAHNEWLTMLINGGVLGAAAYVGIYVTAAVRFLRGRGRNYLLTGIAASCVSYMCYNFFCYQQVLCTPFIFILMGIGEYILRRQEQSR